MKKIFLTIFLLFAFNSAANAEEAAILNSSADIAVQKFYKDVKGGEEFLGKIKGYLVFPNVYKGGFILGGEYGEGVLRVDGQTQGYYKLASGSLGYQIGLQKNSVLIAFITQNALDKFLASNGFTVGANGGISVGVWGANRDLSTVSFESDTVAFVYDEAGLMGGIAIDGTQIWPIQK